MENVPFLFRIRKSLSAKITWMNAWIILLAFVGLIFVVVRINYQFAVLGEKQKMDSYISNTLSSVDGKLKDMGRVSLMTFSDVGTQKILLEYESYGYAEQLESVEYLRKLYTSLISIREDINSIYLFDESGLIFCQDNMNPAKDKDSDIAAFLAKVEGWEGKERSLSGCRMVVGLQPEFMRYDVFRREDPYSMHCIYLVRAIRSFSPNEQIGHICLITNMKKIREVLNQYRDPESEYMLLTEEGEIACSEEPEQMGKLLCDIYPEIECRIDGSSGTFEEWSDGRTYLFTYQKSDYSGLTLVTRKPLRLIWRDALQFMAIIVVVFLVLLGVTVWMTFYGTRRMLKPLMNLSDSMAHFDPKDMGMHLPVVTEDETGRLIASFNKMMDIISQLIESEYEGKIHLREAQLSQQRTSLLYLKSQINPHFLYNTLDMIRIKAELNGDKEVSDMIMQMADFFRLGMNVESQMVSVSHEIRLIQAYLRLMQYRYPHLNCEYELDESVSDVKMPNFILQPLVENSIIHGLRQKGYRGTIRLTVGRDEADEQNVVIKIYDDGAGIPPEAREYLEHVRDGAESPGEELHIGVLNVQKRLKIYYPDMAGLSYTDNLEGGVTVTLMIKKYLESEEQII